VGTRPEVIKMAPVILELRRRSGVFSAEVLNTGQHRELTDRMFAVFGIAPDHDLRIMTPGQTPNDVAARVLTGMRRRLRSSRPDWVLAQGDTTTVMAVAMACFHERLKFGHVEAGLRTGDLSAPYPEEFNRRVAALAATLHFAPTARARDALLREGVAPERAVMTGNTIVDAVRYMLSGATEEPAPARPFVLMTCHRRESFGEPIRAIFRAVRDFAARHPEWDVVYPVHPNPHVVAPAREILGDVSNVKLGPPMGYVEFLKLLKQSAFLLSDSGGVQEEAAALGKPVLVMREVTERPEGVEAGVSRLVGADPARIRSAMEELASGGETFRRMARPSAVYGDGRAAERIADALAGI
jgi:UDP-N-acetylglucosamine 2-epimerase (non-hydrolysing)